MKQIQCTYNLVNCTYDLHWFWSWEYGNCWQFNSNLTDYKKAFRSGKNFGLNIQVFLINNNNIITTFDDGVIVFVHNSSFGPSHEVFIKLGEIPFIQVERTFIQKQPKPYSDCIDLT